MPWQGTPVAAGSAPLGFSDDALRFIWITDNHHNEILGTRETNLRSAIADCNAWRPNAFVTTGDVGNNYLWTTQSAWNILRSCQRPVIWCIGNHDEYEETPGIPNTADLEQYSVYNRPAPFYHYDRMVSGDGTLTALCIALDANFAAADPDGPPPGDNPNHAPGERTGWDDTQPEGGYYRQFTQGQLDWVEATLAAVAADVVIVLCHYPPQGPSPTDYQALADLLQADGRPAIALCGHVHNDGTSYTLTSTDTLVSYTCYKAPSMASSGAWVRATLSLVGGAINVDSFAVMNYTDPGGWTLNLPFAV